LVFELCIIGVMVGYELMGHAAPAPPAARAEVPDHPPPVVVAPLTSEPPPTPDPEMLVASPVPKPKLIASSPDRRPAGSVKRILTVHLESAPGEKAEIARRW
jgi:hypothetical protein